VFLELESAIRPPLLCSVIAANPTTATLSRRRFQQSRQHAVSLPAWRVLLLGDALKKIPELHPALQKSLLALYGFTSDAEGIRHSLLDEPNLTYADAKFMLAACSVFVSYLRTKSAGSLTLRCS
jgi:hypothetical protein